MDGPSILSKIKETDPEALVCFISGVGGETFLNAATRGDAAGHLPKPVDIARFPAILNTL